MVDLNVTVFLCVLDFWVAAKTRDIPEKMRLVAILSLVTAIFSAIDKIELDSHTKSYKAHCKLGGDRYLNLLSESVCQRNRIFQFTRVWACPANPPATLSGPRMSCDNLVYELGTWHTYKLKFGLLPTAMFSVHSHFSLGPPSSVGL